MGKVFTVPIVRAGPVGRMEIKVHAVQKLSYEAYGTFKDVELMSWIYQQEMELFNTTTIVGVVAGRN